MSEAAPVRIFGSIQGRTRGAALIDAASRAPLQERCLNFRWRSEIFVDPSAAAAGVHLLRPADPRVASAAATRPGTAQRPPPQSTPLQRKNAAGPMAASNGAAVGVPAAQPKPGDFAGSLASQPYDMDGTEDPLRWSARMAANAGGCATEAPDSCPVVFTAPNAASTKTMTGDGSSSNIKPRFPIILVSTLEVVPAHCDGEPSTAVATLGLVKTYIRCLTSISPYEPQTIKINVTRRDILRAVASIEADERRARREAREAAAQRAAANPYAAAAAIEHESNDEGVDEAGKKAAAADGGEEEDPALDDLCGFAHIDVWFTDLSVAVAPLTAVRHDATTAPSASPGGAADAPLDLRPCAFIARPAPPPHVLEWALAAKAVPYGCMPLAALYAHFVHLFACLVPSAQASRRPIVRAYPQLLDQLEKHSASNARDPIAGTWRWSALLSLSLHCFILGDYNVLPVLGLVACCAGLEHVDLSRNALSTISLRRLYEVLKPHPAVRSVDISGNTLFETGGEEILRLLRNNRRLFRCEAADNHFTPQLLARIRRQAEANRGQHEQDAFNFLSPNFAYLGDCFDIPSEAWDAVLQIWGVVTAVPLQRKRGTDEGGEIAVTADGVVLRAPEVPAPAAAPMLAEAMRHVHIEVIATATEDRILRGVFKDFSMRAGDEAPPLEPGAQPTTAALRHAGVDHDGPLGYARFSRSFTKMLLIALQAIAMTVRGPAPSTADRVSGAWADAARVIRGLGETHYDLGLRPWHYAHANKAFVAWLRSTLGPSLMDALTVAAWAQVLALVARVAISGTPLAQSPVPSS